MAGRVVAWVGCAAAAVLIPAVFGAGFVSQQRKAVAHFDFWARTGPPCAPAPATLPRTRMKTLEVDGVAFSRQTGHVSCTTLNARGGRSLKSYPACQFTSPGVVEITTAKSDARFLPGPGAPAFTYFAEGRAHCVVAANPAVFTGDSYRF
jgi:hypothetical protein